MAQSSTIASYLRVASVSIAGYDFLNTLPIAYTIYRTRNRTVSCLLFALLQVVSITVLTVSSVGYFHYSFTEVQCRRFFMLAPIFKVLQQMVSHAILGLRTFNLSRRSRPVGLALAILFAACVILEAITSLHKRSPRFDDPTIFPSNCIPNTGHGTTNFTNSAWANYVVAIIFDVIVTLVSMFYLLKYKRTTTTSMMSSLTKMMLFDGVGYFVALTAANMANLLFYKLNSNAALQTAAASSGYAITFIMSQKLLIHLHEASVEHNSANGLVTLTQNLHSHQHISHAVRSQFESKSAGPRFDLTAPDFEIETEHIEAAYHPSRHHEHSQRSVHVRIERTVKLEHPTYSAGRYRLENYSRTSKGEV